MLLRNIIYKSDNLIVQQLRKGTNNTAIIVGSSNSVSMDDSNIVINGCPHKIMRYSDSSIFVIYFPKNHKLLYAETELSEFINMNLMAFKKVILHGHSMCALCFLELYEQLSTWSKLRTHVVSVSAPIKGTFLNVLENNYKYKDNIHIIVSNPIFGTYVSITKQIPYGIYDQIKAFSMESAMRKSSKLVKALM